MGDSGWETLLGCSLHSCRGTQACRVYRQCAAVTYSSAAINAVLIPCKQVKYQSCTSLQATSYFDHLVLQCYQLDVSPLGMCCIGCVAGAMSIAEFVLRIAHWGGVWGCVCVSVWGPVLDSQDALMHLGLALVFQ